MKKKYKFQILFIKGFAISFLTALSVSVGVYLILLVLKSMPASRNTLIFLTVLLYVLAFGIIKAGMRLKINLNKFFGLIDDEEPLDNKIQLPDRRSPILRLLTFIWLITGLCSVLWLTPAFFIFWFPIYYMHGVIMLFSFIFSLLAAIIYYFMKDNIIASGKERFFYFAGVCLGSIAAVSISFYLMNDKIFVTWN